MSPFDFSSTSTTPHAKCYFTHSLLPSYISPTHPPESKYPFRAMHKQAFTHTLDVLLPSEIYDIIRAELPVLRYARVFLRLSDILAPEFMNRYIKRGMGRCVMVSEGRRGVDDVVGWFVDGVLRLEVSRQVYERAGLQGRPVEDGGRRHQKARWRVELDFNGPGLVPGKKLYARVKRAAEEVLGRSLVWLVWMAPRGGVEVHENGNGEEMETDGNTGQRDEDDVLAKHHPFIKEVSPVVERFDGVDCPRLDESALEQLHSQEESMEFLEWLHLVGLNSPRVRSGDRIDEYLSRYQVPDFSDPNPTPNPGDEATAPEPSTVARDLVRVRWRGLIPPAFVQQVYLNLREKGSGGAVDKDDKDGLYEKWFAMTANALSGYGGCYTVLQFEGLETLTWECD